MHKSLFRLSMLAIMRNKIIPIIVLLPMICGILSSCGGRSNTTESKSETDTSQPAEVVSLSLKTTKTDYAVHTSIDTSAISATLTSSDNTIKYLNKYVEVK